MRSRLPFFAASGQNFTDALKAQTKANDSLAHRIDKFGLQGQEFMVKSAAVVASAVRHEQTDVQAMLKAAATASFRPAVENPKEAVSASITSPFLRYMHRLIGPRDPVIARKFRETQVWLVDQGGKPSGGAECSAWDKVPTLINELLDNWKHDFANLAKDNSKVIPAIARFFQRLVWIHLFVDGNGRLARTILALQARELLGLQEDPILDRGAAYYVSLQKADAGDFEPLENLIRAAAWQAGYKRTSSKTNFDYYVWYDIIDSTGQKSGLRGETLRQYRDQVRSFKIGINNRLAKLAANANSDNVFLYSWPSSLAMVDDEKNLFLSGANCIDHILQIVKALLDETGAKGVNLRIVTHQTGSSELAAYKYNDSPDVEGDSFWVHEARLKRALREFEEGAESYFWLAGKLTKKAEQFALSKNWLNNSKSGKIETGIEDSSLQTDFFGGSLA